MATLKEIANRAHVSVGTVDRVIHRRGRVSLETEQRVKRIISELDYKPNILARSLSMTKTFRFGILVPFPEQDGHYWELPLKGIEKAQSELDVYKVKVKYFYYDKYSEQSFEMACSKMLQMVRELDGLLIAPVLSQATEKFLTKIPDRLPYIFLDSYIPNSRCFSYIGEDSFQSGVLSAKLMRILVTAHGTVAIIKVQPMDYHIEDRVRGFFSYFNNNTDINLLTYTVNARESMPYYKITKKIVTENSDLIGIYTPNACAYQVADYLAEHFAGKKIFVIGYDLIKENISHLKNGSIDFLISQRSEMQGYESIFKLYKQVVLKEKVESRVLMPLDIVTKENLQFYEN
ncbi:substrate-binding domain-containing protein [candidate division KSB1 bacterium]|nr:substrate-binding domain-containing protein [candidate division KSB1 bacterium]